MPTQLDTYRVFISSPSDIIKQREIAKAAVEAMSQDYERRGIRVEPWLWEWDAVSEFGKPAQAVIQEQLGKYDVYVGIMGSSFGSPTEAYGSGTEEEFETALSAYQTGQVLQVGFFFRNEQLSAKSLSTHKLDQLQKIQAFKTRIGAQGLYQDFDEDHQLSLLIQKLVSSAINRNSESLTASNYQYNLHTSAESVGKPVLSQVFFRREIKST